MFENYILMNLFRLAKRAAIATETVVVDGKTIVQVVNGVKATEFTTTILTRTFTRTETDNSFVCK
jgi:hypothetical protein